MTAPAEKATLSGAAYDGAMRVLRAISPLVVSPPASRILGRQSKISEGIRGRRDAATALAEWGRTRRDPARPVAWFHAPSVGEGLQARAVMESLRLERPDVDFVFTHFSPSASALARGMPVSIHGFLPWDTRHEMGWVLDALAPSLVVFTKTEVWPGLAREAARRGIPTVLVAATLPADAGRLRWPAPRLLRSTFGRLDRVAAISADDGERFQRLGVPAGRVTVTGDPGIDSAAERVDSADPSAPWLAPFREESAPPMLVAGSTWGPDEDVLLPAFLAARRRIPSLRMIVAPHEPDGFHLDALESRLKEEGMVSRRLADIEIEGALGVDVALVDRVGVLADLYTVGSIAYVGGGFHRHGLHSVLEPAAAGLPVLFGPRHANARAADDLLARGGAREVITSDDITEVLVSWCSDEASRTRAAGEAFSYVHDHRGAALRSASLLSTLIGNH